ncbi:hypothetical protein Scep_001188 [Stephania cephalantha]|uniref:Uncharacterized protein n=1 Tax=Stephania cephalantha TaxID=152367 RepID=A0AAP0Q341_9MAGN
MEVSTPKIHAFRLLRGQSFVSSSFVEVIPPSPLCCCVSSGIDRSATRHRHAVAPRRSFTWLPLSPRIAQHSLERFRRRRSAGSVSPIGDARRSSSRLCDRHSARSRSPVADRSS